MISIIIPTYNWSSVLKLAIKTALWQTYQDFEILVIGDCCTDDTAEVVASFNDFRIKWHNLPENSGSQSIPNNYGIQMAQGEWIAHLGHDDVWHPTHLEHLMKATAEADFVHSLSVSIGPDNEDTQFKDKLLFCGINPHKNKPIILPPSSIMYKKKVWETIGPWIHYKELTIAPDHDFERRAFEYCKKFTCSKELTVFKFNSSWRKNSYIEKPIHQQIACIHKIETEPNYQSTLLAKIIYKYNKETIISWMESVFPTVLYPLLEREILKNPDLAQVIREVNRIKGEGIDKARTYRGLK